MQIAITAFVACFVACFSCFAERHLDLFGVSDARAREIIVELFALRRDVDKGLLRVGAFFVVGFAVGSGFFFSFSRNDDIIPMFYSLAFLI